MDLSDPYKGFVKEFFPRAHIIADKFHVLRLLHPAINKYRKEITGDQRKHPVRRLLLRNGFFLKHYERNALNLWLENYPDLRQLYQIKEALHKFYRIKNYHHADRVLTRLTDAMSLSPVKEIRTLRATILRWRNEILLYFKDRLTNARTEGYNNVAKVVKRRSYDFRNFNNYRLRLLYACS